MAHAHPITGFLRLLTESLVGFPYIFYQAGFADMSMTPIIDWYHLGPLYLTNSTNISPSSVSAVVVPPGPGIPNGGMQLNLWRTDLNVTGSFNAGLVVLNPLPPGANVLKIQAEFRRLEGPHEKSDKWGAVVHVREGGLPDIAQSPTAIRLALQTAYRDDIPIPGARMVTPLATPVVNGEWFPDTVYGNLFLPPPHQVVDLSIFTLELLINRWGGPAVATMKHQVPNGFEERREFFHSELATTDKLRAAGANIAIPEGNGPAELIVSGFWLYGMRENPLWGFPIVNTLVGAVMRVRFFRRLRAWLIELAFRGVAPTT